MEDKAKISYFYMHNIFLKDLIIRDPNPRMGDIQLMELASWMVNEETRAQEMRRVMKRENREALHINAELFSPRGVINNRINIENDPALAEKYLHTQAQAMARFFDVSRLMSA